MVISVKGVYDHCFEFHACKLLLLFQASGVFLLSVGVWMELQLHKYMEVSNFFSTTIPLVFVSLGGSILCLSLLACCCTVKGKVPLLYIVNQSFFPFLALQGKCIIVNMPEGPSAIDKALTCHADSWGLSPDTTKDF